MAIKPYVSGSVPEQIDVGAVGDDGLSTPLNVTIAADAGTQHADAYTPEIVVKDGEPDYRDRFRGALAAGEWSEWGTLPTIQPVTEAGTVMAIQGRWVTGDPATARVARLSLPQTGITIVEGGELPPATDTGEGTDSGALDSVVPLPAATDAGEGGDTAALDVASGLGDVTDGGEGSDTATLDRVVPVPAATDSGVGGDSAGLDTLVVPGTPTSLTATPGDGSVALVWGAASNATSHQYRHKATSDGEWSEWATTATSTSQTVSGLTNGVSRDFEVRGVNSGVYGTAATVTAAPTQYFTDTFASLDTSRWLIVSDGYTPAVSSGSLVLNTTANVAHRAAWLTQNKILPTTDFTVTVDGTIHTASTGGGASLYNKQPPDWVGANGYFSSQSFSLGSSAAGFTISYWNTSGTRYFWTGSAWDTTNTYIARTVNNGDAYKLVIENDDSEGQMRFLVYHGATLIATTGWVSDIRQASGGGWYLGVHDSSDAASTNQSWQSASYVNGIA